MTFPVYLVILIEALKRITWFGVAQTDFSRALKIFAFLDSMSWANPTNRGENILTPFSVMVCRFRRIEHFFLAAQFVSGCY